MGCKKLSEAVKETTTPVGIGRETVNSQKLHETIVGRAPLIYYQSKNVKRNEEWLKRLKVLEVSSIEISYTLTKSTINETEKESTTTCIVNDTLYVTPNQDFLDISQHIANNIYNSHEWKDIFFIFALLTTDLSSLKRKGYPVDHIFRKSKRFKSGYSAESYGQVIFLPNTKSQIKKKSCLCCYSSGL